MSVASFVAAQSTEHGVPHALTCLALELSESWFYKSRERPLYTSPLATAKSLYASVLPRSKSPHRDYYSPR